MHEPRRYHLVSIYLHWAIAGLIVLQFVLAALAELAAQSDRALRELALLANHKSVGITILALAILRLAWRIRQRPPPLPAGMAQWQKQASMASHWLLYVLVFLLPVSGWLMSSAKAYSVSWFNAIQLPDIVGPNDVLADRLEYVHQFLAMALLAVASLHVLAALKHHFLDRDGVLDRMSSRYATILFAGIVMLGALWLGSAGLRAGGGDSAQTEAAGSAEPAPVVESSLAAWDIDTEASYIRFSGDQAGAGFDGEWEQWTAIIRFDSERLAESAFDVTVHTAHVDTEDADRDGTLQDPEWFDTRNHPQAYFRASRLSAGPDGWFDANGQLVVKGIASPALFRFRVEADGRRRVLTGTADLLRLDHKLGTGEWADTTWIGNEVAVSVRVEATVGD